MAVVFTHQDVALSLNKIGEKLWYADILYWNLSLYIKMS